jgi:uncharacterized membrane protein YhaH (DUF805 family)
MNPSTSMLATHPQGQQKRIIFAFLYNLINVVIFILCIRLTNIIRSDGPTGFGELIIKSWIFILSLALFCSGIALSFKQYRATKPRIVYFCTGLLITMVLAFFAVLGVIEACNDSKGYCRNWQIVAVVPNISFKADGYAAD